MHPVGQLRERLKFTQSRMAEKLDCTQSVVHDLENLGPPSREMALLLWDTWRNELHELRISLDDLLRPFPAPPRDNSRPAA